MNRSAVWLAGLVLCFFLLLLAASCADGQTAPSPPTPTPISEADQRRATLENQLLPRMGEDLAELITVQPWLDEVSAAEIELVEAILEADLSARRRGEADSVLEILEFASEQAWYGDGLHDSEAQGLTGINLAYSESLSDMRSPSVR